MKANINGVEVEGTVEEIAQLMSAVASPAPQSVSTPKERHIPAGLITKSEPPKTARIVTPSSLDNMEDDPKVTEFLTALYRYKADRHTQNGKAAYIVKLLATGEPYTIKNLMRIASANQTLVSNAVRRAADAGCVIEVSGTASKLLTRNTKVRLISLGTVEQAIAIREKHSTTRVHTPASVSSTKTASSAPSEGTQEQAILRLLGRKDS